MAADYVTATDGTGLVHTAPAFGADDYADRPARTACRSSAPSIRTARSPTAADSASSPGLWFKDADKEVLRDLRKRGLLAAHREPPPQLPLLLALRQPLLQYATETWFVRTTALRDALVEKNRTIGWHPEAIGLARFGNWLEGVVDWALSRRRYWGTPLPVWKCDLCPAVEVVGSYEELFELSGRERPAGLLRSGDRSTLTARSIDEVTWECYHCREQGERRRLPSGRRRHRRLVRLGRDALRPAPLSVREPRARRVVARRLPSRRLHRRRRSTRRAAGSTPCTSSAAALFDDVAYRNCIVHRPRQRRAGAQDVEAPRQRRRPDEGARGDRRRRAALVLRRSTTPSSPRASRPGWCARRRRVSCCRSGTRSLSSRSTPISTAGSRARARRDPVAERRADLDRWILHRLDEEIAAGHRASRRLRHRARRAPARGARRRPDQLVHPAQPRPLLVRGRGEPSDKEAAYQTLYAVLTTLARLIAPVHSFRRRGHPRDPRPQPGRGGEGERSPRELAAPLAAALDADGTERRARARAVDRARAAHRRPGARGALHPRPQDPAAARLAHPGRRPRARGPGRPRAGRPRSRADPRRGQRARRSAGPSGAAISSSTRSSPTSVSSARSSADG